MLDKFSLYYPDNAAMKAQYEQKWPLLLGYSFRTACLAGSLNRSGLNGLRRDAVGAEHGLVIDDTSEYEDCAYMEIRAGARMRKMPMRASLHLPREEGEAAHICTCFSARLMRSSKKRRKA